MNSSTNHQGLLAEQFFIDELTLIHDSYSAIMQIKRWKFILRIPGIGNTIITEAGTNIRQNFFSFVSASALLSQMASETSSSIN